MFQLTIPACYRNNFAVFISTWWAECYDLAITYTASVSALHQRRCCCRALSSSVCWLPPRRLHHAAANPPGKTLSPLVTINVHLYNHMCTFIRILQKNQTQGIDLTTHNNERSVVRIWCHARRAPSPNNAASDLTFYVSTALQARRLNTWGHESRHATTTDRQRDCTTHITHAIDISARPQGAHTQDLTNSFTIINTAICLGGHTINPIYLQEVLTIHFVWRIRKHHRK